jgi:hypothetical protein
MKAKIIDRQVGAKGVHFTVFIPYDEDEAVTLYWNKEIKWPQVFKSREHVKSFFRKNSVWVRINSERRDENI